MKHAIQTAGAGWIGSADWRRSMDVVSRFAGAIVGGYVFAYGFVALATWLGFAAGLRLLESQTLAWLLVFIVYLVAILWGFSARSVSRVWLVLAGGGAAMSAAAWVLARSSV